MADQPVLVAAGPLDLFQQAARDHLLPFREAFEQALDAGVGIDQLIVVLHQEGVQLPPMILQMLGL